MESIKPKKSLVEQTYEILLDAICTGELAPGERLTQDQIAARLNVSRQPVNSAISILKANSFVEDTGRRGVVVSALEPDRFQSIFEFRSVIEPFAVELAGARLPGDAEAEANTILRRGAKAVERGDARLLLQADIDFHEMIYRWSGNSIIEVSMRVNWMHIRRSMAEVLRNPEAAAPSWQDHGQIVQHLLEANASAASDVMRSHIDRAYEKTMIALNGKSSGDAET